MQQSHRERLVRLLTIEDMTAAQSVINKCSIRDNHARDTLCNAVSSSATRHGYIKTREIALC